VIVRRNAFSTFLSAQHEGDNRKLIKPWKKNKTEKVNLILSHQTFFNVGPLNFTPGL
jgi:hypothetical protein